MNLDNWLHSAPPADIYVLGFQEIVPLNAGNILGAEDNGPARKWLGLIKRTLNDGPNGNGCMSSPFPVPVAEWDADFEGSLGKKASAEAFFPRWSFQSPPCSGTENDRRFSVCDDRVIFGYWPRDFDARCGLRISDCSSSGRSLSDYSSGHRPSDYSCGQLASDFCGSDEDCLRGDSPRAILGRSAYTLVASKQMVGIFLMVWVRSELDEHIENVKVSCVGRGLMGYLGNKGSVSISMSLHQTSLCFVCSHLTAGEKEGDELRRNADVMEILRKTRFPQVDGAVGKSLVTILQHDRIFWLGDLNYRIALPFRSAKALVEMQNWKGLLEQDQLRIERRRGRVFVGWREGKIFFPPTYKYSHNSDRYASEDVRRRAKRRTPAWCDRILWYGSGIQQVSYVRGESRFSDHRPVSSVFWAEIESVPNWFRKSTDYLSSPITAEDLLPRSQGYTELCFF